MRTDYLTDIRDINYDLLPEIIRNEFEKVRLKYCNSINNRYVKNYQFSEMSNSDVIDLNQTKIENRVIFNSNFYKSIENQYDSGFQQSLDNEDLLYGIKKKADKVLIVFATIYNKLDSLDDNIIREANEVYKLYNLDYVECLFYQYGKEVGNFIKGWQLILNNFNLFEDIFNKYYQTTDIEINDTKIEPDFNKNYFNKSCFELFNYLIENYEKERKVKYINIYKYLKNLENHKYFFNIKIDDYKLFIKEKFEVEIKKFGTAQFKYDDTELPILKNLTKDFEKTFKEVENT